MEIDCRGRNRAGVRRFRFHVGEHVLPRVSTYTYLGVTLHERLVWTHHISELLCRGERKRAACVSWTSSTSLPLHFAQRIFQSYARPSACFGLEFVPQGPSRLCKWGRRLLAWPSGSPRVAVRGQLGWHAQAASLCALLYCAVCRVCVAPAAFLVSRCE